jgi:malic enzyme
MICDSPLHIFPQIYRQKDKTFLKILNELREGIVSKRSKDLLEQQIEVSEAHSTTNKDSQDEHNEKHAMAAQLRFLGSSAHNTMMSPASVKSQAAQKIQPTRLFSRNKDVDDINENELTALDGKCSKIEGSFSF